MSLSTGSGSATAPTDIRRCANSASALSIVICARQKPLPVAGFLRRMVPFIQRLRDCCTTSCCILQPDPMVQNLPTPPGAAMGTMSGTFLSPKSKSADVAQLVEQLIRNQQVIGSSPIVGSNPFKIHHRKAQRWDFAILPKNRTATFRMAPVNPGNWDDLEGRVRIASSLTLSVSDIS